MNDRILVIDCSVLVKTLGGEDGFAEAEDALPVTADARLSQASRGKPLEARIRLLGEAPTV
ncbi:MAG TPA: hypothetical protein VK188_01630 [Holophaga sp.]|nr:hypothetical protein [Holophaga sp.]